MQTGEWKAKGRIRNAIVSYRLMPFLCWEWFGWDSILGYPTVTLKILQNQSKEGESLTELSK